MTSNGVTEETAAAIRVIYDPDSEFSHYNVMFFNMALKQKFIGVIS